MTTQRGATGVIYREPQRDRNGDPVDDDGNVVRPGQYSPGTITGIITGGLSASVSMQRQESSDTSGQIGIPNAKRHNPSGIKVKFGDRIALENIVFRVTSTPRWTEVSTLGSAQPEYTWVEVEGVIGGG